MARKKNSRGSWGQKGENEVILIGGGLWVINRSGKGKLNWEKKTKKGGTSYLERPYWGHGGRRKVKKKRRRRKSNYVGKPMWKW